MKFNIINLPKVDSTNGFAQQQIKYNGLREGDVIFTLNQEDGRGQGSNRWESEQGCNLLISIILEPYKIAASRQFVLTQLVSLAIAELILVYLENNGCSHDVKIKWPNDIYVDDKKIAGILFQNFIKGSVIEHSIVGIGINLNQRKFLLGAPNPISMINLINKTTDIQVFLHRLLQLIDVNYKKYSCKDNFKEIESKYIAKLFRYNVWANYFDDKGPFAGKIIDVDEYGRLIMERKDGTIKVVMFGDIGFVS